MITDKQYFMLSEDGLREVLANLFEIGWWVRQDQRPHSNDAYGTIARDKAVAKAINELRRKRV